MSNFDLHQTMYVFKKLLGAEDITRGFEVELQKRAGNAQTKVTQLNASHLRGVLVFDTLDEMEATPVANMGTIKGAIVKSTGQIYFYEGEKWVEVGEKPTMVDTVDELRALTTTGNFAIVKDLQTGGVFVFDETKIEIDNGGTIFKGWVRQYYGSANVQWFGAIGNGKTDDSTAIQTAMNTEINLFFPKGEYLITKPLQTKPKGRYVGEAGSKIVSVDDIEFFKLASETFVSGLEFKGQIDRTNQVGVLVDGGASTREVFKTTVENCVFTNIGGTAYKHINTTGDGFIVANSIFKTSKVGWELGYGGNGLNLTGCVVDSCNVGVISAGGSVNCSATQIINNSVGVKLVDGVSGVDSKTILTGCNITGSVVCEVSAENVSNKGTMFIGCSIFGKITLVSSDYIYFKDCNLSSTQISFNQSNNNYFESCITSNILVTNDIGGVKTKNFFVNCVNGNAFSPENVSELSGGYLEVWEDVNDFSIANNQASTVTFSKSKQNLPYHSGIADNAFFDKSTGTFDFTQIVNPSSKDTIKANIQLCLNDTSNIASQQNLCVYLYAVDSAQEDINSKIDLSKIVAVLTHTGVSLQLNAGLYVFSGTIPRGKYKLVVRCNNLSGKKFYKQGTEVNSARINAPYKARFWGI